MRASVHRLTHIDHAADELEHILDAALARIDLRNAQGEETSMGHCYDDRPIGLSTGQQRSQHNKSVAHMHPTTDPQQYRTIDAENPPVVALASHRQLPGQLGMPTARLRAQRIAS